GRPRSIWQLSSYLPQGFLAYRRKPAPPPGKPGNPAPGPGVFPAGRSLSARREVMIRLRYPIALTLGVAALGTVAFAASPKVATQAQARAERACRDRGVTASSAAWELCLSYVTRAYEWGEITLAQQLAHAAGDARENCLEHGLSPNGASYRACLGREIE